MSPTSSEAFTGKLTTSLVMLVWPEIAVIVGALLKALTFQVKEAWAFLLGDPSSVTVMVTLYGLEPAASSEMVPEIMLTLLVS